MSDKVIDPDLGKRDILEFEIPRDVLDILLKDRTTGKNILWMTDGYEHLESIFGIKMGIHDPIDADAISRPGNKIIRPRVDKSKEEQRKRVQKKAEAYLESAMKTKLSVFQYNVRLDMVLREFLYSGGKGATIPKVEISAGQDEIPVILSIQSVDAPEETDWTGRMAAFEETEV